MRRDQRLSYVRMRAMNPATWLDEHLLDVVAAHRTGWATDFARALMDAGTSLAVLVAVALLLSGVVVARRAYRPAAAVTIAVIGSTVAAAVLKQLFDRARPPAELALVHVSGAAMPSTHAARTAAAAVAVLVAATWSSESARRSWGLVMAAGTVIIGACLVYLGVHWPSDVLVGWALGIAIGTGAGLLCRSGSQLAPVVPVAPVDG
jgi:membrane-associated phospholipid phosphatase